MFLLLAYVLSVTISATILRFTLLRKRWVWGEFIGITVIGSVPWFLFNLHAAEGRNQIAFEDILVLIPHGLMYCIPVFVAVWWAQRVSVPLKVESAFLRVLLVVAGTIGIVGAVLAIPGCVWLVSATTVGTLDDLTNIRTIVAFLFIAGLMLPVVLVEMRCKSANAERIRERRRLADAKAPRRRQKDVEAEQ